MARLIDFKIQYDMAPNVALFYAMVEENYLRFKKGIEGIAKDEFHFKGVEETENSIAQLTKHLAYTDLAWNYRIRGSAIPGELEKVYGPSEENGKLPSVDCQTAIHTLLDQYDKVMMELKETCICLSDEDLSKRVSYEGKEATIRWGLWHIADHNRYHQAHIQLMKKWYKEKTFALLGVGKGK